MVDSRGDRRRKEIIEAALRLIGRSGREGLTHRAVAKEAGVPLGATTYYFESRDDLLAQTLEYVASSELERFKSEREELAKIKTPAALAKFVTERLVHAATDRDAPSTSSGSRPGGSPSCARRPGDGATPSSACSRARSSASAVASPERMRASSSPSSTATESASWHAAIRQAPHASCGRS